MNLFMEQLKFLVCSLNYYKTGLTQFRFYYGGAEITGTVAMHVVGDGQREVPTEEGCSEVWLPKKGQWRGGMNLKYQLPPPTILEDRLHGARFLGKSPGHTISITRWVGCQHLFLITCLGGHNRI